MVIKAVVDEDFVNYKDASMFIIMPRCTLKCDIENCSNECQNSKLLKMPNHTVPTKTLVQRFLSNTVTSAVVFGGLEPLDSYDEVLEFIQILRETYRCDETVVIYTGYTEEECAAGHIFGYAGVHSPDMMNNLIRYKNIVIKYGRYRPNQDTHFDKVLGVQLASDNQYAVDYI